MISSPASRPVTSSIPPPSDPSIALHSHAPCPCHYRCMQLEWSPIVSVSVSVSAYRAGPLRLDLRPAPAPRSAGGQDPPKPLPVRSRPSIQTSTRGYRYRRFSLLFRNRAEDDPRVGRTHRHLHGPTAGGGGVWTVGGSGDGGEVSDLSMVSRAGV